METSKTHVETFVITKEIPLQAVTRKVGRTSRTRPTHKIGQSKHCPTYNSNILTEFFNPSLWMFLDKFQWTFLDIYLDKSVEKPWRTLGISQKIVETINRLTQNLSHRVLSTRIVNKARLLYTARVWCCRR